MRYKLLLLGENEVVIDDVYNKCEDSFEIQTSSKRYSDIKSHVRYYKPDAIVFCLFREDRESINNIVTIKNNSMGSQIPLITIGDEKDTTEFRRQTVNIASLMLVKPLDAKEIRYKVISFLDVYNEEKDPEDDSILPDDVKLAARARKEEQELAKAENDLFGKPAEKETNHRKTILVVDDDVRMLKVIKHHLEEEFEVATATSGIVALRYMRKRNVDLVLLDYMMPNMTGADVLRKIRGDSTLKDLPVLFLTGASEREKIAEALTYKPQGYMLKPVDKDVLMSKLHELLSAGEPVTKSSNPFL